MNIRYLQSNYIKLPEDNLVKFLYNIIMQDIKDVDNYQEGRIYNKGDRVYLQENGKHQIFQCLVDETSVLFVDTEWSYILETYGGNIDKLYNLDLKEEVHYIEEYNRDIIYTNLEFNSNQSTVAVYCGKKRYVVNHDFTIDGNKIAFKQPFDIGDRLILEVREVVGTLPETLYIILYDLNSNPYRVGLNRMGALTIDEYDKTTEGDIKYGELVTGDRTYVLLVDGGSRPYELKAYRKIETYISGTNDEIFKVEAIDDKLHLVDCSSERVEYTDTKYILGLDNKFYTLSMENGNIIATEAENTGLEVRNVDLGVKIINDKFESLLICIDGGDITLKPYIDNGGYHNINFIDRQTKQIVRMSITEDNTLELNNGIDEEGYSGTRFLSYFYFFDEEWTYKRMYVENGLLYYEPCVLDVIPDSRGINLLKKDGEMLKLRIPHSDDGIHAVRCISLDNLGTFESPIEGFVVKIDDEVKIVTVNKDGSDFEILDTNLPFRTNHHYILSKDNKVYKLIFNNNQVSFNLVQDDEYDEYEIECMTVGAYIKSYERITRFDIVNGECILYPISTFFHRIKSEDGNVYAMDVVGDPYEEVLSFIDVRDLNYDIELGSADLYLEGTDGTKFIANIDDMGRIVFREGEIDSFVDYNITTLIQSSQGLYRILIENENIKLEKMFDNMYESDTLSYGNLIKKGFNVQLNDGSWYTFAANGLGEVVINEVDRVNATGLLLRSDDGYNYGLGMIGEQFTTYKSFISNPIVQERLYIKDAITGTQHALFMSGNRLCSEVVESSNNATNFLIMNDAYKNEYKIEISNNILVVSAL